MTPLEAVASLAARYRVGYRDAVVIKDGSNLVVHLAPTPIVLRVATFTAFVRGDPRPWLEREMALASFLAAAGASVAPPSDLLPPGPHVVGGWAMSAWRYVVHQPGVVPDALTALRALDELHAAMRGFPGDLPLLNPASDDLDRALRLCVARGLTSPGQADDTRARRDGLVAELLAAVPDRQTQHGDAFAQNTLVTPAGEVVWIDLEDCCSGPVLWDLGTLVRRVQDEAVVGIVRDRHGAEALRTAIALRQVQVDVWTTLHEARAANGW